MCDVCIPACCVTNTLSIILAMIVPYMYNVHTCIEHYNAYNYP